MTWEEKEENKGRHGGDRRSEAFSSVQTCTLEKAKGRHGGDRRSDDFQDTQLRVLKGEGIDIVARRVGLGSGDTYKRGKAVVKAIDHALVFGDILRRGALLRMTLNDDSINAASKLLKKYEQMDEEEERKRQQKEKERLRQQEEARQRYLEAAKKAEHCTLYHCSVAELSQYVKPVTSFNMNEVIVLPHVEPDEATDRVRIRTMGRQTAGRVPPTQQSRLGAGGLLLGHGEAER